MRRFDGGHAAALRDNLVVAPVGRAVTLLCAGPLLIARNRLVSQGTTGRDLEPLATSVLVANFGISNEWTIGLLLAMLWLQFGKPQLPDNVSACDVTTKLGVQNVADGSFWPPITAYWPSGKSLFTENRRAAPRRKGSRDESPSPRASKQSRALLNVMPRVVSPVTCRA